jgi:hypothetical protein
MDATEDRRKAIYLEMVRLRHRINELDRELTRIDYNLPEPWRRDKAFVPEFLRTPS